LPRRKVVLDKLESAASDQSDQAAIAHEVLSIDFPLRRVTVSEYDNAKRQFMEYVRSNPKTPYDSRDMSALHIHGGIMERYEKQQPVQFYTSRSMSPVSAISRSPPSPRAFLD
jgi:hypothetical protein